MSDDLAKLFARDPLLLTKTNIDDIVADHRGRRAKFASKDATEKRKRKARPDPRQIDLEELIARAKS